MKDFLNYTLLQLGDYTIRVSSLLLLFGFLFMIFLFLRLTKRGINRAARIDSAKKYAVYSLIKYCAVVFAFIISLQILGLNISVLLAGSAALLVGVGLGLQNLFSDFISGIILLADSTVKVDDVIEVNGLVCRVQEINLRTTTVLTRDDKYIILPNSDLTRNQLINWTHSSVPSRFQVEVGVDYSSDVKQVMLLLKKSLENLEGVLRDPEPFVRFTSFGDSSLNFALIFWSAEDFRVENVMSEIRVKIFELFTQNNITIPFPQRVIHMNKE